MNQTDTLNNILRALDRAEKRIERLERNPTGSGVLRLRQQTSDLSGITGAVVVYSKDDRIFSVDESGNVVELIPSDGWLNPCETWTYASSTTITVPSGAANKYKVGYPIRWKQGGAYKYAYIVGVADTLLTVTGGSDYSVANSAITDNYYSIVNNPIGFPSYINYTPSITVTSGSITTVTSTGKFIVIGRTVYFTIVVTITNNGTGSGAVVASLPITGSLNGYFVCSGRENALTGYTLNAYLSSTLAYIRNYNNTYPGANGAYLYVSGEYFI